MKSLKLVAVSAFLSIGAFCTVLYTSCSKDECKGVTCQNGGTCSGGNCTCATGYEGTNCEKQARSKFIKAWAASDVPVASAPAIAPYSAVISASTTSSAVTDVVIGGFSANYFTNAVKASVSGNTITIASQQPDNDGYAVSGTGTYNTATNKIDWTYSITQVSSGTTISYTGTWQ
jgi:hypothetical protein